MTFPSRPEPVPVPPERRLVASLDRSDAAVQTIRGETCTLVWRRAARGSNLNLDAGSTELFVYVVRETEC
jgi:hypothetical protein